MGFDSPDVVSVTDPANPYRYLIRVQEVTVLTEAQKGSIREHLCLLPEGAPISEDKCPANVRATEVKFSPGGDKISTRYEVAPDLAGIAK